MSIIGDIGKRFFTIIRNIGYLLSGLACIALILSAYCGYIDPRDSSKLAIIGLVFPVILIINAIGLVAWLFFKKYGMAIIMLIGMLFCTPQILTFSPINIGKSDSHFSGETFKVLNYNVMNFSDLDSINQKGDNRTLKYILEKDADFVLMQEGSAKAKMDNLDKIQSLMPELNSKYPYRERKLRDLVILSKYPYTIENTEITLNAPLKSIAYKVDFNGRTLYIINVHLESLKFQEKDKELFRTITDISKSVDNINESTVEDVKASLLTKLAKAFKNRASQAEDIRKYINSLEGENVIVCGDFNDTPYSYSYLTIKGDDMSDAYVDCALGPTITFHTDRFYFKIDQILYRGGFKAIDIERGNTKSSDHYPLLTTFKWEYPATNAQKAKEQQ